MRAAESMGVVQYSASPLVFRDRPVVSGHVSLSDKKRFDEIDKNTASK